MKDVVAHFKKLNGAEGWGEWEVDQVNTILFAYSMNIIHDFMKLKVNFAYS